MGSEHSSCIQSLSHFPIVHIFDFRSIMVLQERSQIVDFFTNKVIFLTGCTGFLGKLIMERMLRVCKVRLIYVLVRQKKGKAEEERFQEMFDLPLFERLKTEQPDYLSRLQMVVGNCASEELGIDEDNWRLLHEEVHVVVHCAATIRFDQSLRLAYNINIRATRDLLLHARKMKHLLSFIHVSTAYSNCTRMDIEDKIYDPPITDEQVDIFLRTFKDDKDVERMTHAFLGKWPNTYSFSKCVGEKMVVRLAEDPNHPLPVSIIRPSIIISTWKEPLPGWVDNFYGPIGVAYGVSVGLLRTLHCNQNYLADMVPADYVINAILAIAWDTAQKKGDRVEVYNYTANDKQINWKTYMEKCKQYGMKYISERCIWRVTFSMHKYGWMHNLHWFVLHTVPAYLVDKLCSILGKEQLMVDGYNKMKKFIVAINYFTLRQWNMKSERIHKVYEKYNKGDAELFEIRMSTFEWDAFMPEFLIGGRIYLIKDPLSTLTTARRKYRRLQFVHWTLVTIVVVAFVYVFYFLYSLIG